MGLPRTPDERYLIIEGKNGPRLWRATNPHLEEAERQQLIDRLMTARRAVRRANGRPDELDAARKEVDRTKRALGERGPPWWTDGAPDLNRRLLRNTPYWKWWTQQGS